MGDPNLFGLSRDTRGALTRDLYMPATNSASGKGLFGQGRCPVGSRTRDDYRPLENRRRPALRGPRGRPANHLPVLPHLPGRGEGRIAIVARHWFTDQPSPPRGRTEFSYSNESIRVHDPRLPCEGSWRPCTVPRVLRYLGVFARDRPDPKPGDRSKWRPRLLPHRALERTGQGARLAPVVLRRQTCPCPSPKVE